MFLLIIKNSAMPPSLGSMTSQCLQQRDGYPYMFSDPLHPLNSPYTAHSSRGACNPAVAHQQSHYSSSNGSASGKINDSRISYIFNLMVVCHRFNRCSRRLRSNTDSITRLGKLLASTSVIFIFWASHDRLVTHLML